MEEIEERKVDASFKAIAQQVLIHGIPLLAFVPAIRVHITTFDWVLCVSLYFLRMFFVTGIYHRYFSHKTYKTSRVFQFLMAIMAQTTMQKGVLWWGSHHRVHHRTSDTPADPHSMKLYGFWYSHLGWIIGSQFKETHFGLINDFAKFKELKWINKYHILPGFALLIAVFVWGGMRKAGLDGQFDAMGGLATLVIGFFLSTMLLYHGTFSINSIMHFIGKQRYKTGDESRNSFILAIVTLGEGWHNNHHYYMSSTRQGFYWWEIDITYYILKLLSFVGLIWDIKEVPREVRESNKIDQAA